MKKKLAMVGKIIGFILIYFAAQFIFSMIFSISYTVTHMGMEEAKLGEIIMENQYILSGGGAILTLIIFALILRGKEKNLWQKCNFKKLNRNEFLKSMFLILALNFFTLAFVNIFGDKFESYKSVSEGLVNARTSIFSMLVILVIAPVFEEIFFRGIIFNELKSNMNVVLALVIQGVLFGIFHGNILQAIYASLLGVVLGVIYMWTGSIWSNILGHFLYNILGSTLVPMLMEVTPKLAYLYLGLGFIVTIIMLINIVKDYKEKKSSEKSILF